MKQLPLLASSLYCQPWCILPQAHAELGRLYHNYVKGELPIAPEQLSGSGRVKSGLSYEVNDTVGLAVIMLEGVVAKRAPDMMCGPSIVDLAELDRLLVDIAHDESIRTLVFYMDSPGGCGIGIAETVANIGDVRASGTRVVCYTDYQMCSAMYWLAASCDEIYAAPSAQVGSIGTYVAALDDTRAMEMEGLKLKLFRDGKYKAMGHSGKEWTPEEEVYLEGRKAKWGAEFKDYVRAHRAGIEDATMQGQTFDAQGSPAGLVDGLARSLDDLLMVEMEALMA